ncbi:MAG: glycosyltransferase, partial [Anaerolineae bacterium]|nr:glycosyltransferase [Anaerolineae bacterium]
ACGRAIVTTDTPGCREIVRHGESGLLVPPHDLAELSAAIRQLIEDGERRHTFGVRGRQMAEAEFGLEHICAQTLAIYARLLEGRPA